MAAISSSIDQGQEYIPVVGAGKFLSIFIIIDFASFLLGIIYPPFRQALMLGWLPASSGGSPHMQFGILPLIGYAFAHAGLPHLLFNMMFLWLTGKFLSTFVRTRAMIAILIIGIIIGGAGFSLVCFIIHPVHSKMLSGASAGVLAICGALWAISDKIHLPLRMLPPFNISHTPLFISPRALRGFLCGEVIISLLSGPSVASLATHISSLAAGYLIGYLLKYRPAVNMAVPIPNFNPQLLLIYDKLRRSGYDSLSCNEKIHLRELSRNHITRLK